MNEKLEKMMNEENAADTSQEMQSADIPQEAQSEDITQETQSEDIPQETQSADIPQEAQSEDIAQETKKVQSRRSLWEKTKNPLLVAFFSAFSLGIFAPVEMYFNNVAAFWFDLGDIIPGVLIAFADIFLVVFFVCILSAFIGGWTEKIVHFIFSSLTLMLYIQGNFMQINYGDLGQETIDFSQYKYEGISNAMGWCGMIAILLVLFLMKPYAKYMKIIKVVSIYIVLIQAVTLLVVGFTSRGYTNKENYVATTENQLDYSKDENYIVIIADTFDARVITDMMQNERDMSSLNDVWNNFTFYKNAMTAYNLTDFSVPHILTGKKYLNQCSYGDYANEVYKESPFLNTLANDGYELNLYSNVTLPQGTVAEQFANLEKIDYSIFDLTNFMLKYYKLLGFRYLPHYLKEFVYFDVDYLNVFSKIETINGREPQENEFEYQWMNTVFGQTLEMIDTTKDEKSLHVLHIQGLHSWRDLDLDGKEHEFGKDEEVSLDETAKVVMTFFDQYFDKLRELGIYDDSVIVVLADHGAAIYDFPWLISNGALFVKGRNEKHDFVISNAPIAYDDLQNAFINLHNGKTGDEVFGIAEDAVRERFTYITDYEGDLKAFSQKDIFAEYSTDKPAYEWTSFKATGNVY